MNIVRLHTRTQGTNPVSIKPCMMKIVLLDPLKDVSNIVDGFDVFKKVGWNKIEINDRV